MPRGGTLRIRAQNVTLAGAEHADGLSGPFLQLEVEDTGTGMTPEALSRAFEPFFTTKSGGTGLGLAQVYGFARQSGGLAHVVSHPGKGTCVTLLLPRAHAPSGEAVAPAAATEERPLRILVVEDDEAVAALVIDMIRHLGHLPMRASDPADALAKLEDGIEADLVFTDVLMPGSMDGLDLAQAIRAKRPALPVLLTSGYGGAPARVAEAGLPLLRKPYSLDALRQALTAAAPAR
jgi:CheY-like chemotaxis protein